MKRVILCVLLAVQLLIGETALADWKEIPLKYEPDGLKVYGHAYASEMPGGEIYIVGRAILENSGIFDRRIKSAYITVFTEMPDGTQMNMTVLGEEKKIAPKIVERNGDRSAMSFSGIVRGIPYENLACCLKEESVNTGVICSPRGIVEAKIYEDEAQNLILQIELAEPIECDYDVGWGIRDKNGTLQWYEASVMSQGESVASLKIPSELRTGYVDNLENIDFAFAELYVHIE